jgi:ketosteroid isomerase-like protein
MAPIQKFITSFNKGDVAGAAATHAAGADLVIIDEVSPYVWRGPKAFQSWGADLESDAKKNGITEPMVTIKAYVIVPAVYTYKQGGKAMREAAQMTVVLKKDATGWLIHGWTWTGPRPQAAK